jgi:dipeptidyl-peptidase-4
LQDRRQTWLDLCAVDAVNGSVTRLMRDAIPAWIKSPGDVNFLPDGSFVWLSPRDGRQQLYYCAADGLVVRQLTNEPYEVRSVLAVSPGERRAFFSANPTSPLSTQICSVRLDGGPVEVLTPEAGTHSADFNADCRYFFDTHSTFDQPPTIWLRSADGRRVRAITPRVDNDFERLDVQKPEWITVPTPDGQPLDAVLIRPSNFDVNKKYPVLVHVYGGPQTPTAVDRFRADNYLWHQYLAQHGYVIWICDNRSASYRAVETAWSVYGNLGTPELADVVAGVEWLKSQPWVDSERIGIWGWSYGGYMAAFAMTHSDLFKAGIAGAPVTDWKNYDAIYTERYMRLPSDNPEGYARSSVLGAAPNLHGRLLLVHGATDDNVHLANTLQLADALQEAGKPFELMIYPQSRHAINDEEKQLHLRRLMTEFLLRNL